MSDSQYVLPWVVVCIPVESLHRDVVVVGPFRSEEAADKRCAAINEGYDYIGAFVTTLYSGARKAADKIALDEALSYYAPPDADACSAYDPQGRR